MYVAGLDWTATPSLHEPHPYGPCLVAVTNETGFEQEFQETARRANAAASELKGHNSPPEVLIDVMRLVRRSEARVGVLLLDKRNLLHTRTALPPPAILRRQMAVGLIENCLRHFSIKSLLCDEDIRGKKPQQEFRTAVYRCNRPLWPQVKIKVGFRPSHHSVLIQTADIAAYVMSRYLRGGVLVPELRQLAHDVLQDERNVVTTVEKWSGEG